MAYFPSYSSTNVKFIIKKISNSKKEIEIVLVSNDTYSYESGAHIIHLPGVGDQLTNVREIYTNLETIFKETFSNPGQDLVISLEGGEYIPIVNVLYTEDVYLPVNDTRRNTFVIRINKALPASIKKLAEVRIAAMHSELAEETIVYGGKVEEGFKPFGNALTPDFNLIQPNKGMDRTHLDLQNYNELTGSIIEDGVGPARLTQILSGSIYNEVVDYSDFSNFVFFGSANQRLLNFREKIYELDKLYGSISSSLVIPAQVISNNVLNDVSTHAVQVRKEKFSKVESIIAGFTGYEKWLYFDSQTSGTGSMPSLGGNYASALPFTPSADITTYRNYDGFDYIIQVSGSDKEVNLTRGMYNVEEYPFSHSTGSFYLSFLMKASSSISNNFLHRNSQTSSNPIYPYDSMHTSQVEVPNSSGSRYQRYVFCASASYWETDDSSVTHLLGLPNGPPINFGRSSSDIKILTGGNTTGSNGKVAFGEYKYWHTNPFPSTGSGAGFSGSFVPKGDLFDLTIKSDGLISMNGTFTDIKVTRKKPTGDYNPFSYAVKGDSDEFTNWFTNITDIAKSYDDENINRLLHNIPRIYQDKDNSQNIDLIKFCDMTGEFFDDYKVIIDDYYRVFNQGYSDYEELPTKFTNLLAQNVGWEFINPTSGSILDNFGLDAASMRDRTKWSEGLANRILNNIMYLYKTKGTQNSVKALLSCYGFPSNILRLREAGTNTKDYYQSILTNDTQLVDSLKTKTGSFIYKEKPTNHYGLIVHPKISMSADWNSSGEVSQSAIEGVFKMYKTHNTMSLIEDKADDDSGIKWRLLAIPSSSNQPTKARIKFELNTSAHGGSAIATNNLSMETPFLEIKDSSLVNIILQKSSSGHDITDVHTYELVVGKMEEDGMKFLTQSKLEVDGDTKSIANKNFLSGSANRLQLVTDYTGSVSEIKMWNEPLKLSSFKQHILNKSSVVGNSFSSSLDNLVVHYALQENYKSGSADIEIRDTSVSGPDQTISLGTSLFTSTSVAYDSDLITNYILPAGNSGGGNLQFNDNMISIEDAFELQNNLNPDSSVLKSNTSVTKDFTHNNKVEFARSPGEVINDFLIDNFGSYDYNDLFSDPRDDFKDTYKDLDDFYNRIIKDYGISVEINKFIRHTSKLFDSNIVDSLLKFLPARTRVTKGTILKPTLLERHKFPPLRKNPDIEHIHKEETDILGEDVVVYSGEHFSPPETDTDWAPHGFIQSKYGYANIDTGSMDLEYTLNTNRREFPEVTWGTSSNDTHFISKLQLGVYNDGNTYHNEERVVFRMWGDTEFVSGSKVGKSAVYHLDLTEQNTFDNKMRVETTKAVGMRDLGTTTQIFSTDSMSYGLLLDDSFRYPQNHVTTFGGCSHFMVNRGFYKGYKYEGKSCTGFMNSVVPGFAYTWTDTPYFPVSEDGSPGLSFEDLSTASFYAIKIDTSGTRLKIVKDDEQGTTL